MIDSTKSLTIHMAVLIAVISAGCSRKPARVHPPSIDATSAGRSAIDLYDTDGDGALNKQELLRRPIHIISANMHSVLNSLYAKKALKKEYPAITPQRITGHQYIAPLRKTDPGLTFNWRKFRSYI